jgi:hypothetical protein
VYSKSNELKNQREKILQGTDNSRPESQPKRPKSIEQMLARLKANRVVLGLVAYGSDHAADGYTQGDFDLFVILREKDPAVESLHFYVAGTPVDLNLLSLDQLRSLKREHGFAFFALLNGQVIIDRSDSLDYEIRKLRERASLNEPTHLSQHELAFIRHGHRHVFDKLRNRLESMPLTSRLLLHSNIYWLVVNYFQVRGLPYRGEKKALEYLKEFDPQVYAGLQDFYAAENLERQVEISRELSQRVLTPIGGLWRKDEVLAFGNPDNDNLQRHGKVLFRQLFKEPKSKESPDGSQTHSENHSGRHTPDS